MQRDEPPASSGRLFPATAWSVIRGLKDGSGPAYARSMERLAQLYWKPVYCLLRRVHVKSDDAARDLTQEFFARTVLEGRFVKGYDFDKGSFRAFLKGALTNFVAKEARDAGRQKRGGQSQVLSLEGENPDLRELLPDEETRDPSSVFDEAWTRLVLARAIDRLRDALVTDGRQVAWEIFRRYDLEQDETPSYAELGRQLALSPDQVKHQLSHARAGLRAAVTEIVSEYVSGPDDLRAELEQLLGG